MMQCADCSHCAKDIFYCPFNYAFSDIMSSATYSFQLRYRRHCQVLLELLTAWSNRQKLSIINNNEYIVICIWKLDRLAWFETIKLKFLFIMSNVRFLYNLVDIFWTVTFSEISHGIWDVWSKVQLQNLLQLWTEQVHCAHCSSNCSILFLVVGFLHSLGWRAVNLYLPNGFSSSILLKD